jgi:hypothetical protein
VVLPLLIIFVTLLFEVLSAFLLYDLDHSLFTLGDSVLRQHEGIPIGGFLG